VLIVEDQVFNLCLLVKHLVCLNIEFDVASNGQIAIELFKTNMQKQCCSMRYRIIFSDLNMPIMNGVDFCSEVKKF